MGASGKPDRACAPDGAEPAAQSQAEPLAPSAAAFEARAVPETPWLWEVWDIGHEAECNHFPVLRVDTKGAGEDLHERIARICARALNNYYAVAARAQAGVTRMGGDGEAGSGPEGTSTRSRSDAPNPNGDHQDTIP